MDELIKKLEALKWKKSDLEGEPGRKITNTVIDRCLAIARQHQPAQPSPEYRIDYQKGVQDNPHLDRYMILQLSNKEYIAEANNYIHAKRIVEALSGQAQPSAELVTKLEATRNDIFYWMTRNVHTPEGAVKVLGQVKESLTETIAALQSAPQPDEPPTEAEIETLAVSRIATWLYQKYDRDYDASQVPLDIFQAEAREIWGLIRHYPRPVQQELPEAEAVEVMCRAHWNYTKDSPLFLGDVDMMQKAYHALKQHCEKTGKGL